MQHVAPLATLSRLGERSAGVFRGRVAAAAGVSRKQLSTLRSNGVIERVLPDTYRIVAVARSSEQSLRAALAWGGDRAAADGRSAAEVYRLEGVRAPQPEIVLPRSVRGTAKGVNVRHVTDLRCLMIRTVRGIPVTGVECTLVALAHLLDGEAFEIACEDARRRRLTSIPAVRAYLDRFGRSGRPGVAAMRRLLDELDPAHPANSTLEVKTRRLLVQHGLTDFVREFPLEWNGRTYRYDFAFARSRTVLETNGRRWHDDAADYEHDHEKWSVPGRHGYRLVLATWEKVTTAPDALIDELATTIAAS
jgi:hypothetical protein